MTTSRLPIVAEGSGTEVGWIRLADDQAIFSGETAANIFRSVQRASGWNDQETFDALATGWSNGYVTVPATP